MKRYLRNFETQSQYESFTGSSEYITPNVSHCNDNSNVYYNPATPTPPHDYSQDYLTFVILSDTGEGTPEITAQSGIYFSKDNGANWVESYISDFSVGDKILAKANGVYGEGSSTLFYVYNCTYKVEGNAMSLIGGDNFRNVTAFGENQNMAGMFCVSENIISAENLVLPATTLSEGCYYFMFGGCTSLTKAPSILPATTLTSGCYKQMFSGCTSLTTSPELPAATLAGNCYESMFGNCGNLNYIKCLATDISAEDCTSAWLGNVAASGTFIKSPNITESTWGRGYNGIPNNWTVQDAS